MVLMKQPVCSPGTDPCACVWSEPSGDLHQEAQPALHSRNGCVWGWYRLLEMGSNLQLSLSWRGAEAHWLELCSGAGPRGGKCKENGASQLPEKLGISWLSEAGDRVFTMATETGRYAEYTVVSDDLVPRLPDSLDYKQEAAIGIPYFIACRALFHKAQQYSSMETAAGWGWQRGRWPWV
uniref:Uncharacterized protein n=2 Tax=Hucho hucho TaxID=62062 RepID=A0A4W5M9F2_9TELE